jgi:hypothetical protein
MWRTSRSSFASTEEAVRPERPETGDKRPQTLVSRLKSPVQPLIAGC